MFCVIFFPLICGNAEEIHNFDLRDTSAKISRCLRGRKQRALNHPASFSNKPLDSQQRQEHKKQQF